MVFARQKPFFCQNKKAPELILRAELVMLSKPSQPLRISNAGIQIIGY
jgi:hypothetical protein